MVFNSLKSRILISTTGIVLVSLTLTILILQIRVSEELSAAFDENAVNLLQATISHVETQHRNILFYQTAMLERRKAELKNNTTIAFAIINAAYHQYRDGQISEELAKQRVLTELQMLRYDNQIGYFWINDISRPYPRMVMHPTIPRLNGEILDDPDFNSALGRNENLFKAFVDICLEKGEGYVDYYWPKPVKGELTEKQPKISYVRLFKTWDWVVGTGVYIDDIENDVQTRIDTVIKELNLTLNTHRIGENGYFAIFDDQNRMLVHPSLLDQGDKGLMNSESGDLILEKIKMAAFGSEVHATYQFPKPGSRVDDLYDVKAFASYYEPLGWYIYTAVYTDDFNEKTTDLTRTIILLSSFFIFLAVCLSLLTLRSITKPLNLLIRSINQTDSDGIPFARAPNSETAELKALSKTINTMVTSISSSRKELKSQRDFSQGIIDGAPFIIAGLDLDGITTFINPAGEKATGYSKDEIIGKSWLDLFFPDPFSQETRPVFEKAHKGGVSDFEMTLTCKDGKKKQIIWNSYSKKDKYSDSLEIYWFGNDITDRKLAEESLRNLRNYLLSIINSMPSVLVGIDVTGAVTQWNTAAQIRTGISPDHALGKTLEEVFPDLILNMADVREAMQSRQILNGIKQVYQVNGDDVHEDVTIYPLIAGDAEGAVIRIDDVTEKVRMEEMMIQSEKMLSVGGLAAGMAHEINNPLAAMMQTADVVASRLVDDLHLQANQKAAASAGLRLDSIKSYMQARGIPRMISNIKESGQRVAAIVNNMLSFARKSEDQVSSQQITSLVDKTLELAVTDYDLKQHYDFRLITIVKEYEEDLPPVTCEGAKIQQVLLNILRNGAQAMQVSGTQNPEFTIRAHLAAGRKMIQLEIEDNGPGIEESIRPRIFEPFFTTKPIGVGTGLGLSVSYFIVTENHGGELIVESQRGTGSTFIIRLPLDRRNHS